MKLSPRAGVGTRPSGACWTTLALASAGVSLGKDLRTHPRRRVRLVAQMALTECPDCEGELSTEALVCPHCGRPTANVRRTGVKRVRNTLILWGVSVVFFLLIWQWMGAK